MDKLSQQLIDNSPLCGRAAISAGLIHDGKITGMFMPAGIHTQSFWQNGVPVEKTVNVTREAASELQSQLEALNGSSRKRAYFDFDHEGGKASGWPTRFFWQESPEPGVYYEAEASASGLAAIQGKDYRSFSPVFHIEKNKGSRTAPAKIVANPQAEMNMGGFVNDPAFEKISPIWAKNPGVSSDSTAATKQTMPPEQVAELQAKNQNLEIEIQALKGKATRDAVEESSLKAKQAEKEANDAKIEVAALKAKNKEQSDALHARNVTDAKTAVAEAVRIGAIAPQDSDTIAAWEKDITETPARAALLAKMPGNAALLAGRVAGAAREGSIALGKAGAKVVAQALFALQAANANIRDMRDKVKHSREVAALYAKDIRGNKEFDEMPLSAATTADNIGTLAGTLVALKTLDFLKFEFPALSAFTTDFTDETGEFNQTTKTRIVTAPALMTYDPDLGADGRPKGWVVATAAITTDVPITLDNHKGVEINFDSNTLASTMRNLFEEQAGPASYTLGKAMIDSVYARILAANFATNAAFAEASVDFGRRTFSKAGRILTLQGVPMQNRIALVNSTYMEVLEQDPTLVSLGVFQKPEIITDSQLPKISRFTPFEAPNLPVTGNLAAFFGHKSSLAIKTRVPNDYTQILPGAGNGSVMVVTNPDVGVSVLLVQYVSNQGGYAGWRIAGMWGTAVGNEKTGQIVKSA